MAQTPAIFRQIGDAIDHTPGADVAAGEVVVLGTDLVTIALLPIPANTKGAVATRGVFSMPKDSSSFAAGIPVYWDDNANPVGGTAGSGALSDSSADGPLAGFTIEAAGSSVGMVDVDLRCVDSATVPGVFAAIPVRTVAAAGTVQANAAVVEGTGFTLVTAADDNKGVVLPTAAAGKICVIKNSVADKILKVYPAANDKINGQSANAVHNQGNGTLRVYYAYNAVDWFTDPETMNP